MNSPPAAILNVVGNNKMTHPKLFLAVLVGLFSCGQSSNNIQPVTKDTSKLMHSANELWTLYSKSDTVYHIKKLVSSDNNYILLTYDINTSQPEAAKQTFIKKETVRKTDLLKIKSDNSSYNWTPLKDTPTLFVQIKGSAFTYDLEPWDKRDALLDKIEKSLQRHGEAEWIGCDVGPGD